GLASPTRRSALDVWRPARTTVSPTRRSGTRRPARTGESPVGLPADRWRIETALDRRVADDRAQDSSRNGARAVRDPRRSDVAGGPPCARASGDRGPLLYRRHGLAATVVRALLHRVGQPQRTLRRLYAAPERNLGDPAGSPIRLDAPDACGTVPVPDPGSRPEIHDRVRRRVSQRRSGDSSYADSCAQANGVAERFVRTARAECLDWMLITHQHHLEQTLGVFVEHYNGHRPHRALGLVPPVPVPSPWTLASGSAACVHRLDRLRGLLHEYTLAS